MRVEKRGRFTMRIGYVVWNLKTYEKSRRPTMSGHISGYAT